MRPKERSVMAIHPAEESGTESDNNAPARTVPTLIELIEQRQSERIFP